MPRSTRSPATMSAALVDSSPDSSRCTRWRLCIGRSSGPTATAMSGTPNSTSSPSGSEVEMRITVTVMTATIEPMPRSRMSMELPMWAMSELPTLTTSPVESRFGSVAPSLAACLLVSWTVR